jgi:signal peptidase I
MINEINNKTIKSKKQNKKLKILENIGFTVFMVFMAVLIFITAQSRFTGREPSLFGHRLYIVESGSMSPTIKVDSMIIVKELPPQEIKNRDVITYHSKNNITRVTHRVVGIENNGEYFITRGDANDADDPIPLEGSRLIGKVSYSIPFIGKIFRVLSSKIGIALIITMGIVWMVIPKLLQKKDSKENL